MSFEGDPKLIHVMHDGNSTYRVIKYFHDNGNFPLMKINGIREDTAANIWISSTWSLGFLKWSRSDNSFTRYPKVKTPDEYLSESMDDLLPAQGTSLWLASGAGHGLISYDYATNQQHSFTTDDGLICNNLVSLFRHKNKLWISTVDGLSEFDPNTKIFTGFGLTDGLPETDFARKFVYDSAMNRLYASTPHYVIYFNPDSVVQNKASEPASDIYLQKFRVNGNTVYHDFTKQLDLSPGENNVNMEFSCIDFIHGEKIKFEYQLEGLETRWNPSEKRRFVNYTNLFPGSYRFKVRTINEEGNPGSTIILASFTVGTPFYFTWWFILLVIIVAASLMIMVNSFRNRSRKALMEVRERISRDLHDDIGSTLNSLSIYSEIAKIKNTEESQRDKFLDIIGQSSRNMIEQMNDIVWTVNPLNDKFEHILLRMRSFASEMTEGRNVSLKFEVDKACKSISLGMNERKNFYLIFKEAVNNAMKYSGATEVIVRIRMPENQLTLEICDNGSGFDPVSQPGDNLTLGGNGLRNMKIRAEEIRAGLKIDTRTGSGTRIVLSLKI
jgi:signal transduction histidine kinase